MSEAENMNDGNAQQPVESYRGKLLIQEPPLESFQARVNLGAGSVDIFTANPLVDAIWWRRKNI